MNILQVLPRFAPAWKYGGGVRFNYDLDVSLVRDGHDVTVYTSDQLDDDTRIEALTEQIEGIRVRRFPNRSNFLASRAACVCFRPMGLRRALLRHAPEFDLIHVAEARGPHVRWAFEAGRRSGVPVVWSPLGGLADGVGIRKPYRRGYDIVYDTASLVSEARVLVAQSPHEAAVLEGFGARRSQIRCIGLGVEAQWFRDLPSRGRFRHELGIDPDDPMLLFIGRLHPTKGLDVLLKAAAIVKRTHPRLSVVLVGWDHGALRTVKRLSRTLGLRGNVRVLPPIFEVARIEAYVDADVFAIAARTYEETSLAAMEALASGTCCVVTRQCDLPGFGEETGVLATDCEPDAFAAGILRALADPHRRSRALLGRRAVLAWNTAAVMADAYADLFAEIAGAPSRRALPLAKGRH